jgi:hypothetical protein
MCHFKVIDEHDRLENIVALVHAAGRVNNQPIDLYRLHDYFVLTDEPEDDVADANEEVGLAFGYQSGDGGHARGEIEGENVERDAIEEFLDSTWPMMRQQRLTKLSERTALDLSIKNMKVRTWT